MTNKFAKCQNWPKKQKIATSLDCLPKNNMKFDIDFIGATQIYTTIGRKVVPFCNSAYMVLGKIKHQ